MNPVLLNSSLPEKKNIFLSGMISHPESSNTLQPGGLCYSVIKKIPKGGNASKIILPDERLGINPNPLNKINSLRLVILRK